MYIKQKHEVKPVDAYLSEYELYLFNEGKNCYAYRSLGCHKVKLNGNDVYRFAVYAPNAVSVSVVGSFNEWNPTADPMRRCGKTGVWEAHIGIAQQGNLYKYAILAQNGELLYKADPYAFYSELRPGTASKIWDMDFGNGELRVENGELYNSPMSIYEVHLGSWREGLNYEQLSNELVDYVKDMGYTHIELMPVSEYPLDDSWGYQVTGYYSVTSRYGTPQQFRAFVDACHKAGIGVILDWVAAHFPRDAHGLRRFDGTALYEHPDPRRSDQKDWGTLIFDYGKSEVRSFLISNAVFWLKEFNIDALRVDAVSCMLYLDYAHKDGEWLPNKYGGNENLDAIEFFRLLSQTIGKECAGKLLIAEESTAFPLVTKPPEVDGLGFNFKWNMGWMNDTLSYFKLDSYFRRYNHSKLTFSMVYAFSENYILPFSHDEVVHMKNSLIGRMPGAYDEKFLQLRLLFMYQYAHPGKKLLFMGGEFGQFAEWNFKKSLDFTLLEYETHASLREFVKALNHFYRNSKPLYERDSGWEGFEWRNVDDNIHSVIAFSRRDVKGNELLCLFNFTPVPHENYTFPYPHRAKFKRVMCNLETPATHGLTTITDDAGKHYAQIPLGGYEGAYYSVESGELRVE